MLSLPHLLSCFNRKENARRLPESAQTYVRVWGGERERARERERERARKRMGEERKGEKERAREKERVCVRENKYVCVCAHARAQLSGSVRMRESGIRGAANVR